MGIVDAPAPAPEASSSDAPRRTRSQPIAGRLQDVLSAPETLAAIGGFDWAKGKCVSVLTLIVRAAAHSEATSHRRHLGEGSSVQPFRGSAPPAPPPGRKLVSVSAANAASSTQAAAFELRSHKPAASISAIPSTARPHTELLIKAAIEDERAFSDPHEARGASCCWAVQLDPAERSIDPAVLPAR